MTTYALVTAGRWVADGPGDPVRFRAAVPIEHFAGVVDGEWFKSEVWTECGNSPHWRR